MLLDSLSDVMGSGPSAFLGIVVSQQNPLRFSMKKTFTLALLLIMSAVPSLADALFSTSFATADDFSRWTLVNANNDDGKWTFDEEGTPSKVYYSYDYFNSGDDWLISPEITPDAGGTLIVRYSFYGSSYGESMEVYSGTGTTPESMTRLEAAYPSIPASMQTGYFLVDATPGQAFRVGFRATSTAYLFRLYLCSVEVETVENPVDLAIGEVKSPVTGSSLGDETVTVSVENRGRADASGFSLSFAVDGQTVATEAVGATLKAGESMDYTFSAKADLSVPRHDYDIKVWSTLDSDIDHGNDTCLARVRHRAPATVPYYMGFEPDEYTDVIRIFNLNSDGGTWGIEVGGGWISMARTGDGWLGYNYDRDNAGDDWAILEPISIDEPGYYALHYWYSGDDSYTESFAVYYGNDSTPQAMAHKLADFPEVKQGAYQEAVNILHITEPQDICIGFHCYSPKNQNWITIDDVSLVKVEDTAADLSVDGISNPVGVVRAEADGRVEFSVSNNGITDMVGRIAASVDGVAVKDTTVSLAANQQKTITMAGVTETLAAGNHRLEVSVAADGDADATNNAATLDFVVLGKPVMLWDFESGSLPSDLRMRVEDGGTVSPDAGSEFTPEGWGLFNIAENEYHGEYVLALTSWLEGTDRADRWLVLPTVHVAGDGAYLAWSASSYNEAYPESYEVMASTAGESVADYVSAYSVEGESAYMTERYLNLSGYAGQDLSLAFRLVTANGDALTMDNIGLYGGVTASGIGSVDYGLRGIVVGDGSLRAADGTLSVTVADMGGRTVRTAWGCTMSLAGLQPGVYVATVKAADGSVATYKFAVK